MKIELKNINKTVNKINLLTDINITMESGKAYGFIGSNGCGKTVLFKTILGLMKHTSGNIYVDGAERGDFLKDVGMIIERPNFIPYYSAFQNLKIIASYENKITDEQIKDTILKVGLDPYEKKKVGKYSLGMKQKLAIALAIMENPKVLILDEPFNAIDEPSSVKMRELILEEKKKGKLILIASHLNDDINLLCDVIYKVKSGHICEDDN